ncbi:unnamed protein product [Angiostrongylus costaricensis]|uniref:Secreted protein n=2 Tax=Angiostrongylus TaxID=6312 RepID=A0A158PHX9_ANGCS|nr:unnamed protein product [Angiostrongylus costaricensis]
MRYRVCLLMTAVAFIRSSPIQYEVSPFRAKRDNENSTTMATFTVERLDAPIERIEIRLIDENSNSTVRNPAPVPQESAAGVTQQSGTVVENAIDTNGESADQYDVRYKKARAWLSFSTRTPTDSDDDDLDVLPPEAEESSSDDEYEPVEECLLNKAELPLKTVHRLTEQAKKLGKLIRTRNRLQQQYCINREHPQLNDEYRLCPIWRNEKKVHNYQLMRIKYCADYSKWPNASKLMSTYGDNLNLYETLYAFQKP